MSEILTTEKAAARLGSAARHSKSGDAQVTARNSSSSGCAVSDTTR